MATAVADKPAPAPSTKRLKPLGARVVIKPLQREEMTKSGIVLPDTAKEKPQEGKIVAVGPGGLDKNGNKIEMTLKVGDKVLYQKYAGTEFKIDDEEHLVMHQDDVLALVEG
jgi:chaperonin GroES